MRLIVSAGIVLAVAGCGERVEPVDTTSVDAGPPGVDGGSVQFDAAIDRDAAPPSIDIDGGADGVEDQGVDAGSRPEPDAGSPPPSCGRDAVFDAVKSLCYRRVSGETCPGSTEGLRWSDEADQLRIEDLVAPLGYGGTGLTKSSLGRWWFRATGEAPESIDWAPGFPFMREPHTYFGPQGLRTYHRVYAAQFCMWAPER